MRHLRNALVLVTATTCFGGTSSCAVVEEGEHLSTAEQPALTDEEGNLLVNPSFETQNPNNAALPASWNTGSWGSNSPTFTFESGVARTGMRSVRIDIRNYVSGDAKWIATPISVTPGLAYVYRDYYRSSVTTKLVAAYGMSNGSTVYSTLGTTPPSTDWAMVAYSTVPPLGAVRLTVYHLIAANGTLQIDDAKLALPQVTDMSSGVPNGSFEQTDNINLNIPLSWQTSVWGTNTPSFTYAPTGRSGGHSGRLDVTGYVNGDAKWYFPPQPVSPGTRYLFSDYYTSTVPSFITISFTLTDGSRRYFNLGDVPPTADYAAAYGAFLAPDGAVAATVFHGLKQNGSLQIDDVGLVPISVASLVNGVPNGDLEQVASPSPLPTAWYKNRWGTNAAMFSYANDGHSGTRSVRIDMPAYTSGSASWYFDPQPVTGSQTYTISDYYRSDVDTKVSAMVTLRDGSQKEVNLPIAFASSGWSRYGAEFFAPENAVSVTLMHRLEKVGFLQVDDVSLMPLAVSRFARPLVTLTFDDGYLSDYTRALPILERQGVNATHFIITGAVGSSNRLTARLLTELSSKGHEIASHTVNHLDLTTLSPYSLDYELTASRDYLARNGFGNSLNFASPYGAYNGPVVSAIASRYVSHRTTDSGFNIKNTFTQNRLKVQNVNSTVTVTDVANWAAYAANTSSWLILVYHEIMPAPVNSYYATTPELLDAQVTALKNAGVNFVTMRQAISEIGPQLSTP